MSLGQTRFLPVLAPRRFAMAETIAREKKPKKERKHRSDHSKVEKATKKDSKKDSKTEKKRKQDVAAKAFALLADDKAVDPSLSSLFTVRPAVTPPEKASGAVAPATDDESLDESASETKEGAVDAEDVDQESLAEPAAVFEEEIDTELPNQKRKRKRKSADEDLEGAYLDKLAREEERSDAKRAKKASPEAAPAVASNVTVDDDSDAGVQIEEEDEDDFVPPKHETEQAKDDELSKANRTVFLGNVSTTAISSKKARKTLIKHLSSFFDKVKAADGVKHRLESIRFRSTPYSTKVPRKAAYARKEVMDETTKSTNAYAVYSSQPLAREAAKQLNGTVVLDRHLRADEIAHPAKVDHRRCVFVGNLGFVDDESNIQQANEDEGRETRKRGKEPADVEEGLWRTFGKCGTVESVRVIRDSITRVGKGIAYVQFINENSVEEALGLDGKKFPPMLPRKLRVSRAKAVKRNAKPGSGRPSTRPAGSTTGYQRKVTGAEASRAGRAGKLYGRAAAAQMKSRGNDANAMKLGEGIKKPEAFVFEGHRATSKSGKAGLKLGGKKAKGKPTNRSAKRGAAYKAGKKKSG